MPYKDKEKQKEAIREAVKKHREGITEGITEQGITGGITWEEQQSRFPGIPLPFGDAYYKALKEQEILKEGSDG